MLDETAFSQRFIRQQAAAPARTSEPPLDTGSNRLPTTADSNVGRRIKDLRRNQGLTQKQIATRVGVTGAQFHRYEVGTTRVATSRLIAIASVLGVQPERLMSNVAPVAMLSIGDVSETNDLVELVELFSSLVNPRHRAAMVTFARSLAIQSGPPVVIKEA